MGRSGSDGYVSGGSGYVSGGSGYDSGLSGLSGNSFEARRPGSIAPSLAGGSGLTSRSVSGGVEMSGGLGSGPESVPGAALPEVEQEPPRYVDVATPVRLSRERPRPISLIGGMEVPGFWKRSMSRSRSRGRERKKKVDQWWDANGPGPEQALGRFVQVVDGGQGERELRMSAMVN
ncbi:hypothetical protein BDZ85DRAFT_269572 [Elsinoe ampelina]|uniref:Uncharacterized protein n=1 Tax=Elsinoe ampelina TaxID=302913 RepID=A0A6A6FZP6_9PEZI|nr:hypothetical protein BDZ85DRAFT_269572 [Elsinoe ampelina]